MGGVTLPTAYDISIRVENSLIQVGKIAPRPPMPIFPDIQSLMPLQVPPIAAIPVVLALGFQNYVQISVVEDSSKQLQTLQEMFIKNVEITQQIQQAMENFGNELNNISYQDASINEEPEDPKVAMMNWQAVNNGQQQNKFGQQLDKGKQQASTSHQAISTPPPVQNVQVLPRGQPTAPKEQQKVQSHLKPAHQELVVPKVQQKDPDTPIQGIPDVNLDECAAQNTAEDPFINMDEIGLGVYMIHEEDYVISKLEKEDIPLDQQSEQQRNQV
ncbi:uncharacterized protein LOC131856653 [Cryptomeria japonica]|uniref:uncharacterized protein LOC131856653 n=1 Tax=Cryptomeria japonica TaxID=3369 RepID=UPI0027DA3F41|nr:uncharacterized protein LOC131856653 [Cryptomeria japonica]